LSLEEGGMRTGSNNPCLVVEGGDKPNHPILYLLQSKMSIADTLLCIRHVPLKGSNFLLRIFDPAIQGLVELSLCMF
jgi:hypothetical protein